MNSLQPCSGSSTQRQGPGCALQRHPQSQPCTLTLQGWYCSRGGCSPARSHCAFRQLGQEAASFPSKQRLVRQRQFFETCFECRCAEMSRKFAVVLPREGCLRIREQGENASASTRQRHWKWGPLPFRGEGFSLTELFCSLCSVNSILPLSVRENL